MRIGLMFGLVVALLALPGHALAREIAESSKSRIALQRSGGDDDVTGTADFSSKAGKSRFRLKLKNGPVSQELELKVGGVSRGKFLTSSKGSASLDLTGGSTLDFDPRGREIEIEDASDDQLLTGGGTNNVPGSASDERVNLLPTGVQPFASGHATYRLKKGSAQFNVEIEDVTDGTYDVIVDGVVRGTMTTTLGTGEVEFGDDNGGPALDFDPVGKLIQIGLGSDIILGATFLAGTPGVNICPPAEVTTLLVPTALAPGGSGDARQRVREDCRRDFQVEIEDVPVGPYDLYVDGVLRGTITVAVQPDLKVEGEIEFSSELDDSPSDELPLEFDPTGAAIEVRQGTNVFFSATAGVPGTGTCSVVDSEVDFNNVGPDGDAKGQSRFRQDDVCEKDFRVEIERLPLGDYELRVGGIGRGTITVIEVSGENVGELEFDEEPTPGKLFLDFDPRGQLVEIVQASTIYLSVTMPD